MTNRANQQERESGHSSVTLSPCHRVTLSMLGRAWLALVVLSIRRQANARTMVWIALGLLAFATGITAIQYWAGNWGMGHWRWPRPGQQQQPPRERLPDLYRVPPEAAWIEETLTLECLLYADPCAQGLNHAVFGACRAAVARRQPPMRPTYAEWLVMTQALSGAVHRDPAAQGVQHAYGGSCRVIIATGVRTEDGRTTSVSGFEVFSQQMIFSIFLTFLLPFCSLSFAVEAIGGERENKSLIWLLARPLPRPLIYLAKFVALLPWTLGMNLLGFAMLCLAAGPAGRPALLLYWPAVVYATVTFSALFLLIGATFRWPAVVSIVYSFCLELVFGLMPGYLRYASISYYAKCVMLQAQLAVGVESDKPWLFLSQPTAVLVLLSAAAALLGLGAWLFSRKEYHEVD